MNVILAPDVFVNASVSVGTPPEQVVQRVLGGVAKHGKTKTSAWVLARVEAMLHAVPAFKPEAVAIQMTTIGSLVEQVKIAEHDAGDWAKALAATAKAAGAKRVITDHPDLADQADVDGVEFMSTDAWLVEQTTPPPPPPPPKGK
ncbi:MAG: hypothetical protein IPG81_03460 [Sandaracinaceae bacterium]|nr:hypothetical protein [Sandaracinaceae bacterium]MBK7150858.1 hypothetical protein [Sandaracinaceae bacterium]MBK8588730.1 hypothetical protein [Sandaracinaceae bacterium]MBP7685525.1 hypothetical protein [Deltaproteobacteria bacterium]